MTKPNASGDYGTERGHHYVMAHWVGDRQTIPFKPNAYEIVVTECIADGGIDDERLLAFHEAAQAKKAERIAKIRSKGLNDTQRLVLPVVQSAGLHGITGAEVQRRLNLGHGKVSGALTTLHEAGVLAVLFAASK